LRDLAWLTCESLSCGRRISRVEAHFADIAYGRFRMIGWFAAFVPARTLKPITDKLNGAIRKAIDDKSVEGGPARGGIEPLTSAAGDLRPHGGADAMEPRAPSFRAALLREPGSRFRVPPAAAPE
jgi:hypothetical protein